MSEHALDARRPALLVLESGRIFRGSSIGRGGEAFGEAVFNTAMTGYQEILSDPSYAGQIVVMTASHIGNTGVNDVDREALQPVASGLVVRQASARVSSWRAQGDLASYLDAHGIVAIEGIDTRALTRELRTVGAQRAAVAGGEALAGKDPAACAAALLERVRVWPGMEGQDLATRVTCAAPYEWPATDGQGGPGRPGDALHVVAYDFGIKASILAGLASAGCRVTVVPASTPAAQALALGGDGYFLSNGPGDPAAVTCAIDAVRELLAARKPLFGICLGHQILALALGATTYKLAFGHHGGNHPVKDLASGAIAITAQNHGFAVVRESLPRDVIETHTSLYDGTVEGLRLANRPVYSVQYHPEASPGPHDATHLFARFVESMRHA